LNQVGSTLQAGGPGHLIAAYVYFEVRLPEAAGIDQ